MLVKAPHATFEWHSPVPIGNMCLNFCGCNCTGYYPEVSNKTCMFTSRVNESESIYYSKLEFPYFYRSLNQYILSPQYTTEWNHFNTPRRVLVTGSSHMCPFVGVVPTKPTVDVFSRDVTLVGNGGTLTGDCPILNVTFNHAKFELINIAVNCTSGDTGVVLSGDGFNGSFVNLTVYNARFGVRVIGDSTASQVSVSNMLLPQGTDAVDVTGFAGKLDVTCPEQVLAVRVKYDVASVHLPSVIGCTIASPQTDSNSYTFPLNYYVQPVVTNYTGLLIATILSIMVLVAVVYSQGKRLAQRNKRK